MKQFSFNPHDAKVLARLQKMPVFDALDSAQLPKLLQLAKIRQYDDGETIINEGDTDQIVYFLISGSCSVNIDGLDVNAISKLGDVFGEMGMINHKPRSATITAEQETLCLALDGSFLERMKGMDKLAAEALFYRIFSEMLAARIRDANRKVLRLEDELKDLSVQRPME